MAHISLSTLKKALLATGALTMLSIAAPTIAYAAPGDHSTSKHRHSHVKSDHRRDRRADYRRDKRSHVKRHRNYHRDNYRHRRDHYRPRRDYYRPARHYKRHARHHYTPYRSRVGISFNFGSPGYSRYRWAPAAYSFYQPVYGNYATYRNRTTCRRITVDGWHYGRLKPISVKQCSNPWDGTYIIQGSERVIERRW